MSDAELIQFATEFREGILDGDPSWKMCFAVCAPLTTLLAMSGVKNEMVEGIVFGAHDFPLPTINHVWLRLADGRVLDPTADQFNEDFGFDEAMPPVYLGDPKAHLHTHSPATPVTDSRAEAPNQGNDPLAGG